LNNYSNTTNNTLSIHDALPIFENYCQDAWNLKRRVVDERIQIANTLSKEEFESHGAQLGHKKTLLIATMNEKQREEAINEGIPTDRKSTRLNSSHVSISYAVFC